MSLGYVIYIVVIAELRRPRITSVPSLCNRGSTANLAYSKFTRKSHVREYFHLHRTGRAGLSRGYAWVHAKGEQNLPLGLRNKDLVQPPKGY